MCLAAGQSQDPYERARQAMEAAAALQRQTIEAGTQASLEKQRAAIAQQLGSAHAATGFFITPWPEPARPQPAAGPESPCERLDQEQLARVIEEAAAREGLAPELLRVVIEKESSGRPCAISPKGALGLMQLMPATAWELGVRDAFDPAENVAAGARLLRRLLSRYGGDLALALGAYNAGPAFIDLYGGLPPLRETLDYVGAILAKLLPSQQGKQP